MIERDPQKDYMERIAMAQNNAVLGSATVWAQGQQTGCYGTDRYAMLNSLAFRPGKPNKLWDNDKKLEDCRARRKAAILRISRMVQNETY